MRHLRALCAIADTGSVRKAARRLGVTQPSLTTQLRRIELALGGRLFVRERSGSEPTELGRTVLSRARSIVADMATLVAETEDAARRERGARLRIGSTGSTGSRAVAGWLRRLHARYPEWDTTIHIDVSANKLLRMVAAKRLDAVFVHEVDGCPLYVPDGLEQRVLVAREPQFVALPDAHPAARQAELHLADLADARWMVDPVADGEWDGLRRAFAAAGLDPRVVLGDYMTATDLVAAGEVVIPCQPTSAPRPGISVRPLVDNPLTVRLLMAFRSGGADDSAFEEIFTDLRLAYQEVAEANETYRRWLRDHDSPLLT